MLAQKHKKATGRVILAPVVLGSIGLVLAGIYQAQRDGLFPHSLYSFDRFIQHHLDALGGISSLAALLGVVAGLLILQACGQNRLVTIGTIISLGTLLISIFGLSL